MKRIFPIIFILLLAGFLRLYQLGNVPPSASLDEASIGWNAYSIAKTGADEYGTKFPIVLRAYDDYRPGLYVYSVIPFISTLGLNVVSVRLPSVILSLFDVILVYLLVKKLFAGRKDSRLIGVIAALLLAISPWHIYISRLGHEANLGLFFVILGTYFFVSAIFEKKPNALIASAVAFAMSLYGYQSQKIIVPLLFIVWGLLFIRTFWKHKQISVISCVLGLFLILPAVILSFSPDALIRFEHTSAFASVDPIVVKEQSLFVKAKEAGDMPGIIWHNRRIVPIKIFINNYISHFSPLWLIAGTDHDSFKAPFVGLMYPWELLFIGIGAVTLIKNKKYKDQARILFPILFLSPVAAAVTTMAPHAMRFYTSIPMWQIIGAIGFVSIWNMLATENKKRLFLGITFVLTLVSVSYFYYQYFVIFPRLQSKSYQYALHTAVMYVSAKSGEYTKIIVSNDKDLTQSYMFYLFDTKYDPRTYQANGGTVSGGFAQWHEIGNITFRPLYWEKEVVDKETLFIGNSNEFGSNATMRATFPYLNGTVNVVAEQKLP